VFIFPEIRRINTLRRIIYLHKRKRKEINKEALDKLSFV
jgi:hypothetical protein